MRTLIALAILLALGMATAGCGSWTSNSTATRASDALDRGAGMTASSNR